MLDILHQRQRAQRLRTVKCYHGNRSANTSTIWQLKRNEVSNRVHTKNMHKLKILLVGPCASGKTTVANFLSDATENLGGDYHPTQGVRILEFEAQNLNVNNKYMKAEVELWDCSGDHKFETCWPAFQRDAQGVIFVYNPIVADHFRELELLYNYYITQTDLTPKHSLVLAVTKSDKEGKSIAKLSNTFSRVMHVVVNIEENGNRLRSEFNSFLVNVLGGLRDRNEQEELNIINTQPPSL